MVGIFSLCQLYWSVKRFSQYYTGSPQGNLWTRGWKIVILKWWNLVVCRTFLPWISTNFRHISCIYELWICFMCVMVVKVNVRTILMGRTIYKVCGKLGEAFPAGLSCIFLLVEQIRTRSSIVVVFCVLRNLASVLSDCTMPTGRKSIVAWLANAWCDGDSLPISRYRRWEQTARTFVR